MKVLIIIMMVIIAIIMPIITLITLIATTITMPQLLLLSLSHLSSCHSASSNISAFVGALRSEYRLRYNSSLLCRRKLPFHVII